MRNRTKRLGALGATALVALVVIGPTAASAEVTTTTAATPTTLPVQKPIHGSATSTNHCTSVLVPELAPNGATDIGVTIASDVFGQPHEGKEISLTNTKVTVNIPVDLLQTGVDAGIIFDGQQIPSTLTISIAGDGTVQKQHNYSVDSNVTVHVVGGVAKPLSATINLPNTKWTPVNQTTDVFFHEKAMKIVSVIDLSATLGQVIIATFTCAGASAPPFISLGGLAPPSTTTTMAPTTTAAPTTAAPTVTAAAPTDPNVLPRTGSNTGLLLALAVGLLSAGLFALKATGRRSARSRP